MPRKVVAASFVAVWLALFAIEFSEDTGFFEYSAPDMDKFVEGTLADMGEAIKVSDQTQLAATTLLSIQPAAPCPSVVRSFSFAEVREEAEFSKRALSLHKIQRVFLL